MPWTPPVYIQSIFNDLIYIETIIYDKTENYLWQNLHEVNYLWVDLSETIICGIGAASVL